MTFLVSLHKIALLQIKMKFGNISKIVFEKTCYWKLYDLADLFLTTGIKRFKGRNKCLWNIMEDFLGCSFVWNLSSSFLKPISWSSPGWFLMTICSKHYPGGVNHLNRCYDSLKKLKLRHPVCIIRNYTSAVSIDSPCWTRTWNATYKLSPKPSHYLGQVRLNEHFLI